MDSGKNRVARKTLRYFFLNDELHRKLHINRSADKITSWNYPLHKRVVSTYSDVLRFHEPAFTMREVCDMIGRTRVPVELAILNGNIEEPQYTYGLESKRKFQYMFSEKNIMDLHSYFLTVHRGRPRNDGLITPQKMPTARELKAMIRNEPVLYVKGDNGEFRPVWQAQDFS